MSLLLQLHADLPDKFPGHARRLHIFSCRRKPCRRKPGSVRVLRSTRIDPAHVEAEAKAAAAKAKSAEVREPEKPAKTSLLGNDLFGGSSKPLAIGGNPFALGASSSQAAGANPFSLSSTSELASKTPQRTTPAPAPVSADLSSTFASKARISQPSPSPSTAPAPKPHEPWPATSTATPYPQFYLDADYEALGADPAPPDQKIQLMEVDDGDVGGSGSSGRTKDIVDDAAESHMDKTFQKFADRLYHNPEQVLRYEFEGRPLLYSKTDAVGRALAAAEAKEGTVKMVAGKGKGAGPATGMPACEICGAGRVFEVQLTPHAIAELEVEEDALDGMEWGTVIVGVCGKDCVPAGTGQGEVGYAEEWAGVQWEENSK